MRSTLKNSLLPNKRSRNTSVLWMLFSAIWAAILVVGLVRYWRIPGDSLYETPVHVGFKLLATLLVTIFVGVYAYTLYRMYFRRTSWLTVFSHVERWWIRGALLGIAIQLNILPSSETADWQSAFMFAAIGWALTSNHQNAIGAVFQVAAVAAGILLITERGEILTGTLLYIVGFGVMVAGYVMMNGLVGELMVERGRVADQAVTEERFRLARDLHDTVGHSMTQITLKSELARRMVATDSARAEQELKEIEQISRSLSAQVRKSITGDLRLSLEQEIHRATELLSSIEITPVVDKCLIEIPETTADVLAWCLREGVLNVVKHSGATECVIRIGRDNGICVLVIDDNGPNPILDNPARHGISGMKQRVSASGGTISLKSREVGHILEVRIPG